MTHAQALLPVGLEVYRTIGPFDAATLPAGLRSEHRLKGGTWGLLTVLDGTIGFTWDDGRPDSRVDLLAGDSMAIFPEVPHHLVVHAPFRLSIAFHRMRDASKPVGIAA